jgi:hypothetical protein
MRATLAILSINLPATTEKDKIEAMKTLFGIKSLKIPVSYELKKKTRDSRM